MIIKLLIIYYVVQDFIENLIRNKKCHDNNSSDLLQLTRDIYYKSKRKDPIVAYIVAYVLKLQKNADAFIFLETYPFIVLM